ncbi:uncharacterized protein LOC120655942 [Panicum virgatum]|uniref:uncharacterized protein LOC120655942 n=1 Tax=Panicum virgatum TaxID=38727 RepID=UPI0019D67324|nr:uncharacterized protein LOC120655942 [Panicum virgatum]
MRRRCHGPPPPLAARRAYGDVLRVQPRPSTPSSTSDQIDDYSSLLLVGNGLMAALRCGDGCCGGSLSNGVLRFVMTVGRRITPAPPRRGSDDLAAVATHGRPIPLPRVRCRLATGDLPACGPTAAPLPQPDSSDSGELPPGGSTAVRFFDSQRKWRPTPGHLPGRLD